METGAGLVKSGSVAGALGRLGTLLLDTLYPPVCLSCDAPVATADALCTACFMKLRAISAPMCPVLGLPFEVSLGPGALSAEAIADPPPFDRARAAVIYNDVARTIVSRLKYGDRPELARFCARLMTQAGRELWTAEPVLVPVPLHRFRLMRRLYNQSALLARALGRRANKPCALDALVRRRATPTQAEKGFRERHRNVRGAFAVSPRWQAEIAGRRVVLVDDVYTSGATIKECARALRAAGAAKVHVLTLARVVRPDYAL